MLFRKRFFRILVLAVVLVLPLAAWMAWSARGNAGTEVTRMAELFELKPAMTAGEIGAGKGKMTVAMARLLGPAGKVYSSDLNRERVADIKAAVTDAGLENVDVLEGLAAGTGFPPACCDAIFMSKVYHHFTDPVTMNHSFIESLRPGGRLAVIDFEPAGWQLWLGHPEGVPENRGGHGIPSSLVVSELREAGFEIEHEITDWWGGPFGRYCVIAKKPAD